MQNFIKPLNATKSIFTKTIRNSRFLLEYTPSACTSTITAETTTLLNYTNETVPIFQPPFICFVDLLITFSNTYHFNNNFCVTKFKRKFQHFLTYHSYETHFYKGAFQKKHFRLHVSADSCTFCFIASYRLVRASNKDSAKNAISTYFETKYNVQIPTAISSLKKIEYIQQRTRKNSSLCSVIRFCEMEKAWGCAGYGVCLKVTVLKETAEP